MPAPLALVRWALGTSVPDRVQHLGDRNGGGLRRDARWWILTRGRECQLARVRIGPILHPAMLLALADSMRLFQDRGRPAVQRPDRRSFLSSHQHRRSLLWEESRRARFVPTRLAQDRDSELPQLDFSPSSADLCKRLGSPRDVLSG